LIWQVYQPNQMKIFESKAILTAEKITVFWDRLFNNNNKMKKNGHSGLFYPYSIRVILI